MSERTFEPFSGVFAHPKNNYDAFADAFAREREVERHIETVCDMDAVRGATFPIEHERRLYAQAFRRFKQWARLCGVRYLPATGYVGAFYLFDMLTEGELLGDIECAADAIKFTHEMTEKWIDHAPIDAALHVIRENLERHVS
jgi:hypothetical protein